MLISIQIQYCNMTAACYCRLRNVKILILQISPNPCGDLCKECKFLGDEYRLLICKDIHLQCCQNPRKDFLLAAALEMNLQILLLWQVGSSKQIPGHIWGISLWAENNIITSSIWNLQRLYFGSQTWQCTEILSTSNVICHDKWLPACYLPRWASSGVLLSSQFV